MSSSFLFSSEVAPVSVLLDANGFAIPKKVIEEVRAAAPVAPKEEKAPEKAKLRMLRTYYDPSLRMKVWDVRVEEKAPGQLLLENGVPFFCWVSRREGGRVLGALERLHATGALAEGECLSYHGDEARFRIVNGRAYDLQDHPEHAPKA